MMGELLPVTAAILSMGVFVGFFSEQALRSVDPDASLSAVKRYGLAWLGAAIASVAAMAGPAGGNYPALAGMCAFGAIAAVMAIMDRDTAWAPDGLMLPLTVLAFAMGSMHYGVLPLLPAVAAGVAVFFAAQGLWWLQDRYDFRVLPPPDLLAFVIPAALLGLSFSLAVFYIVTASMILVFRQNPEFLSLFSRKEALDEAAADLGFGDRPAITFLAVAFPVLGLVLVASALLSA